ncbi:hypothetical protein Ciccas_003084 [Cichlidogyrus casuarinus]|uniref:Choline transporter-like protein n=1 Tax=Cichlidogyrus casuarinus TaxID=1844966 RepID=A0ABD2QHQ1_9PLAT
MVYVSLVLLIVLLLAGGGFCFYQWNIVRKNNETLAVEIPFDDSYSFKIATIWLTFGCISLGVGVIVIILVICFRKHIHLAIEILGHVSRMITDMLTVLIYPLVPFLFYLIVMAYFLATGVFLASMSRQQFFKYSNASSNQLLEPDSQEKCGLDMKNAESHGCVFGYYVNYRWVPALHAYNFFMFLWVIGFIEAMSQMTLAGAFCNWYWTMDKKTIPCCPITKSSCIAARYHMGTAAFGSFLIACVRFIRAVILYFQKKCQNSNNCCAKFCLCMCQCCCKCIQNCLTFITKNAYVMTMMLNKSFCPAAANSFLLILRNMVYFKLNDCISDLVLFMGKLIVTGIMALISYLFFSNSLSSVNSNFEHNLNFVWVPVVLVILGTFLTTVVFFQVFEYGTNVIFICVMEDIERNKDKTEKNYYMPDSMISTLGLDQSKTAV